MDFRKIVYEIEEQDAGRTVLSFLKGKRDSPFCVQRRNKIDNYNISNKNIPILSHILCTKRHISLRNYTIRHLHKISRTLVKHQKNLYNLFNFICNNWSKLHLQLHIQKEKTRNSIYAIFQK